MVYRVEIAPRTLVDIESAFLYNKRKSPNRAGPWLLGMLEAIYSLEKMPGRCAAAQESAEVGQPIRLMLYGKRRDVYKIFFSVLIQHRSAGIVRVFHIRHGAQKWLRIEELRRLLNLNE